MPVNKVSTQVTSGKWLIKVNREKFEITDQMYQVIKQADERGLRGMVHFKDFSVSIPHISSMERVPEKKKAWNEVDMSELKARQLPESSPLSSAEARERIAKMKQDWIKKQEQV